jgi:filamentous hemagglutinin
MLGLAPLAAAALADAGLGLPARLGAAAAHLPLGGSASVRGAVSGQAQDHAPGRQIGLSGAAAAVARSNGGMASSLPIAGAAIGGLRSTGAATGRLGIAPVGSVSVAAIAARVQGLPLAGVAAARARTTARAVLGIGFAGEARADARRDASLQGGFSLTGDGSAQGRARAIAVDGLALEAAGASTLGIAAALAAVLDLRHDTEGASSGSAALAASLPLVGGATASISLGSGASGQIDLGVLAGAATTVAMQGGGAIALAGTAQMSGRTSGALSRAIGTAGSGTTACRATGGCAGGFDIAMLAGAYAYADGRAGAGVPLAGAASAAVSATCNGAVSLFLGLRGGGGAGRNATAQGDPRLALQAVAGASITADVPGAVLALTGSARATILEPRAGGAAGVLGLSGNSPGRAGNAITGHGGIGVEVGGAARGSLATGATAALAFGLAIETAATALQTAQGQGAVSLDGTGRASSAAKGAATALFLAIDGDLDGAAATGSGLRGDALLGGAAGAWLHAVAQVAGAIAVAQTGAAETRVAGEALRAVPLIGVAGGTTSLTAAASTGMVSLDATSAGMAVSGAATNAGATNGATFAAQGHATARAYLRGSAAGHMALTRAGLGDALVAGNAARGMARLGAAQAMSRARGAANLPLAPGLAGRAMTAVRMDLAGLGIATAGRANARGTVMITTAASAWAVALTARALIAPPALRRAAAPRIGLSGRIMPTNSGRILRG